MIELCTPLSSTCNTRACDVLLTSKNLPAVDGGLTADCAGGVLFSVIASISAGGVFAW